jgi:AGZA family xanthine/uracil permease-like MFS transporter
MAISPANRLKVPMWVPGDWNAFFGLGTNSLLNILVLSGLLLGVIEMPAEIVFGRIVPAIGLMLFLSNIYYGLMARRLALKEGRTDVTAMPAGPSVPHMFIVVLVIMLPVKIASGDPILAWQVGLAWAFIEGLVNLSGAFFAPYIRKLTPRAALLGTLAGVSIAFISLRPGMQILTPYPWIGLVCLAIVLGGWFAGVRFPGKLPAGLVAIFIGTLMAWGATLLGWAPVMDPVALRESFGSLGVSLPVPQLSNLLAGFKSIAPLLVTAIPFGVYDFIEAMDNVESASAAGDEYSVREVLFVDGFNSIIGTMFGNPFPNAVYIGHPGWKAVGGRIGYSLATGALVIVVTLLNIVPVLLNLIPLVAILPILLYIGALIGAQAFQTTPSRHAPAIILALIPHFAAWGKSQVDGALTAAGVSAGEILDSLAVNGVLYEGMAKLGGGAILSGLILGAIAVFLLDRKPKLASAYALAGAVLSYFGFIHAEQVQFGDGGLPPAITIGYLLLAALCYGFSYLPYEESSPQEEDVPLEFPLSQGKLNLPTREETIS